MALSFNLSEAINYTLLTAPSPCLVFFYSICLCVCVCLCLCVGVCEYLCVWVNEGKRFNEAKEVDPAFDTRLMPAADI